MLALQLPLFLVCVEVCVCACVRLSTKESVMTFLSLGFHVLVRQSGSGDMSAKIFRLIETLQEWSCQARASNRIHNRSQRNTSRTALRGCGTFFFFFSSLHFQQVQEPKWFQVGFRTRETAASFFCGGMKGSGGDRGGGVCYTCCRGEWKLREEPHLFYCSSNLLAFLEPAFADVENLHVVVLKVDS